MHIVIIFTLAHFFDPVGAPMLPVFYAVQFVKVIDMGGRNRPWVVLVNANGEIKPYVVKLFDTVTIDARGSAANEVLGSVLAREFGLLVPKAALIEFDSQFIGTIHDANAFEAMELKDERIKFGCELLDGYNAFVPGAMKRYQFAKAIEIDNLFAFDVLIRNSDRGHIRPNIMMRSREAYLIDHELAFNMDNCSLEAPFDFDRDRMLCEYHIAYHYLKKSIKLTKGSYFHEFETNLRHININMLKPFINQLDSHGYAMQKYHVVTDYLKALKANSYSFVNQLRAVIS